MGAKVRAKLWNIKNGKAVCYLCHNLCWIEAGESGFCGARYFDGRELITKSYGIISAIENRPMEIKPFYHFYPGSYALTFSTYSCNLDCPWCQNWHLSKEREFRSQYVEPEELVAMAVAKKSQGLCASFNEPTILFEYLLDVFSLAKKKGLHTSMVSNGYMTPAALKELSEVLDAINIDVKGDGEVYRLISKRENLRGVWRNVKLCLDLNIHVEVVDLVVSGLNDSMDKFEEILKGMERYAESYVPLHINRYFPAYRYALPPTSVEFLYRAREKAREMLEFVYVGNVGGHESTYCPECGKLLIERRGVVKVYMDGNRCSCGKEIYGKF
jgi:pyruvate formate lyase activating enzyme